MSGRILVVGSSVLDYVVRVDEFPIAGESVRATGFKTFPGGKGANQAVAASRLGGEVVFAGLLGDDSTGQVLRNALEAERIDCKHLETSSNDASGAALIGLDRQGQNQIMVALGANMAITPEFATHVVESVPHDVLLLQCEIPLESIIAATMASLGIVILNPAPYMALPEDLFANIDYLTPNEHEAASLTGHPLLMREDAVVNSLILQDLGLQNLIITLGDRGVFHSTPKAFGWISAPKVVPVDTVGAGDAFNGALAFAISHGANIEQAASFACHCASISVTKLGAQSGSPRMDELPESVRNYLSGVSW